MTFNNIDIYSEDFFAEDPFGEPQDSRYYDEPLKLSLTLYTVEEDLGHSDPYVTEQSMIASVSQSNHDDNEHATPSNDDREDTKDETSLDEKAKEIDHDATTNKVEELHADDAGTNTTCRSTDYDIDSTDQPCHPDGMTDSYEPQIAAAEEEKAESLASQNQCTSPSCLILHQTVQQQQEQIVYLRRKLQEYADLCHRYGIGQELLPSNDDQAAALLLAAHEPTCSGTTRTTYKEKTYAELMGPWDIPFHIELQPKESFGEFSGITFGQHPSKTRDSGKKIRRCPMDDDDALPVTRQYQRRNRRASKPSRRTRTNSGQHTARIKRDKMSPVDECSVKQNKTTRRTSKEKLMQANHHVRYMAVFLERKYGRQKALYSGTIDPTSGCPHGVGTFQFVKSGDEYTGEVAYGEMHGKGMYCHQKTNKTFQGKFVRNSLVATSDEPQKVIVNES